MRHAQLLKDYIDYVGLSRTPATQQVHKDKMKPLLDYWENLDPAQFTRAEFERYLVHGKEKGWKPRTHQILLDVARAFIRWAQERSLPVPDFAQGLKKPQVHQGKVVFFEEHELAALLKTAGRHPIALTLVLGAYAGCRRGEIYAADWADVDWAKNTITVHGSKTYKDREIPMAPTLQRVLRSHWRGQKVGRIIGNLSPAWKANIRRDLRLLCKKAGVPYKSPHALRRSFATLLLLKGAAISTTKDLGGWTSLKTVSRYAGTTSERMQAAVELLG